MALAGKVLPEERKALSGSARRVWCSVEQVMGWMESGRGWGMRMELAGSGRARVCSFGAGEV